MTSEAIIRMRIRVKDGRFEVVGLDCATVGEGGDALERYRRTLLELADQREAFGTADVIDRAGLPPGFNRRRAESEIGRLVRVLLPGWRREHSARGGKREWIWRRP